MSLLVLITPRLQARPLDPVPFTIWHDQDRVQADFLQSLSQEFSRTKNASIELESGFSIITALILAGEPRVAADEKGPSEKGAIDIDRLPEALFVPADYAPSVASIRNKNRVDSLPIVRGNHFLLYYNKKLVDVPLDTWSALAQWRARWKARWKAQWKAQWKKDSASPVRQFAMELLNPYLFLSIYANFAGVDKIPRLEEKPCEKTLDFFGWVRSELDVSVDCGYQCTTTRFLEGKTAVTLNGDWIFREAEEVLGKDLGVAAIPQWRGKDLVSLRSGHSLIHVKDSRQELFQDFGNFLRSPAIQTRWWTEMRRIPAKTLPKPTNPNHAVLIDRFGSSLDLPISKNLDKLWLHIERSLKLYFVGSLGPTQACEALSRWTTHL